MPDLPNRKEDPDRKSERKPMFRRKPEPEVEQLPSGLIYVDRAYSGWRPYVGPSHPGIMHGYNSRGDIYTTLPPADARIGSVRMWDGAPTYVDKGRMADAAAYVTDPLVEQIAAYLRMKGRR